MSIVGPAPVNHLVAPSAEGLQVLRVITPPVLYLQNMMNFQSVWQHQILFHAKTHLAVVLAETIAEIRLALARRLLLGLAFPLHETSTILTGHLAVVPTRMRTVITFQFLMVTRNNPKPLKIN
jgi:hypothetical protein